MQIKKFLSSVSVLSLVALLAYFYISYLPRVFSGELIPQAEVFTVGNLDIKWYGLLIALGALVGYILAEKSLIKNGVPRAKIENILLITIISGLVGARLGFVLQNVPYYIKNSGEIFALWQGGLSIQGALILGLIGLYVAAKRYNIKFMILANSISPQVMLAGAIGRYGNFFNQEIIGKPNDKIPWKMYVGGAYRPDGFSNYNFFHPVFLYESTLLFLAYLIYLHLRKKCGDRIGLLYTLVVYSLIRIFVEFFRIDYRPIFLKLDLAQWIGAGIIIAGVAVSVIARARAKGGRYIDK